MAACRWSFMRGKWISRSYYIALDPLFLRYAALSPLSPSQLTGLVSSRGCNRGKWAMAGA